MLFVNSWQQMNKEKPSGKIRLINLIDCSQFSLLLVTISIEGDCLILFYDLFFAI